MSENISTVSETTPGGKDFSFAAIRKAMDDFEELHPAKDRPVRIRCGHQMLANLMAAMPFAKLESDFFTGLPIDCDDKLPYPEYCVEMADGWEIHIMAGVNIRRKTER